MMTRKVGFSSGHRYWIPDLDESENRQLFGQWASPFNHGHNYTLWVTVTGVVDATTGMIVNIKVIDDVLQHQIIDQFDGKSINDEVEYFHSHSSSTESVLQYIASVLSRPGVLPPEAQLIGLELEEMPGLRSGLDLRTSIMTLTRTYEFAAAHRLHVPSLTTAQNLDLFGKCNNPAGHGHNYVLEVTVEGQPDPKTGMMVDIGEVDTIVNREVVDRYDHRNFNEDIPEFKGRPTSSEMIVQEIFDRLKDVLPAKLKRVRLHETARNTFDVEL
jgi:6-pyruvoyltetrahydropterin/6-carboxytetrahydropterin synthase